MEIRTVGELRTLVEGQENKCLKLGELEIRIEEGGDLEIHLFDELAQWWNHETESDKLLTDDAEYMVSSSLRDAKKDLRAAKKRIEELEEAAADGNKKLADAGHALGKVEAYEKIFVGRGFSVEK